MRALREHARAIDAALRTLRLGEYLCVHNTRQALRSERAPYRVEVTTAVHVISVDAPCTRRTQATVYGPMTEQLRAKLVEVEAGGTACT